MKLRHFIPPVVTQAWNRAIARSFAAAAAAWRRGDDVTDGPRTRLTRPYAQSAWVSAAVKHVAGEISNRPLKFYRGDQEYADAAFTAFWAAPALGPVTAGTVQPRLSISQVLRDLASWRKLEGEYFICLDDAWLIGPSRNPAGLTPFLIARPDRMRLIVRGGELEGYAYTNPSGRQTIFLPEQVIHRKAFNPYDDWRGLGDLEAALVATEGAFLTGVYIRDLMRNNGDQGFIVVGKSGPATDEQREAIVADLRAKRAALRQGVAKDLFLTGDIAVERPPERAASTDLNAGKAMSHQEIFVAFGVPPSMAEVKQSYSIGKDSDRYQLITGTCQPLGNEIAEDLAKAGSRIAGQALTGELDWDDHPVMVDVRNSRLDQALKLWGAGMAWKEVNDYLDLGMKPFAGWEIPYLPFSVAPVDTSGREPAKDPASDPQLAEQSLRSAGPADPAIAQLRALVALRMRASQKPESSPLERDVLAGFTCNCGAGCTQQRAARPPAELAQWRTLVAARRETVQSFRSAFTRVLMQARAETLRKIQTIGTGKAIEAKAGAAADFLFDLAKFTVSFRDAMGKQQKSALDKAGQQLLQELGSDDPFKMPPSEVVEYLRKRENKMQDVSQSIWDRIEATIEEGLENGDTTEQLSGRVKGAFNELGDAEARRVAQTETGAAYGAGRHQAMRQANVPFKTWLTSGNSNVRQAHADANGQTVPIDEPFIVDGEELMYPGDDSGSAGNVINCHCVSVAKAAEKAAA